jgi:predicted membrane-bound spermidine synthase
MEVIIIAWIASVMIILTMASSMKDVHWVKKHVLFKDSSLYTPKSGDQIIIVCNKEVKSL